jgi:hypothetical protein
MARATCSAARLARGLLRAIDREACAFASRAAALFVSMTEEERGALSPSGI